MYREALIRNTYQGILANRPRDLTEEEIEALSLGAGDAVIAELSPSLEDDGSNNKNNNNDDPNRKSEELADLNDKETDHGKRKLLIVKGLGLPPLAGGTEMTLLRGRSSERGDSFLTDSTTNNIPYSYPAGRVPSVLDSPMSRITTLTCTLSNAPSTPYLNHTATNLTITTNAAHGLNDTTSPDDENRSASITHYSVDGSHRFQTTPTHGETVDEHEHSTHERSAMGIGGEERIAIASAGEQPPKRNKYIPPSSKKSKVEEENDDERQKIKTVAFRSKVDNNNKTTTHKSDGNVNDNSCNYDNNNSTAGSLGRGSATHGGVSLSKVRGPEALEALRGAGAAAAAAATAPSTSWNWVEDDEDEFYEMLNEYSEEHHSFDEEPHVLACAQQNKNPQQKLIVLPSRGRAGGSHRGPRGRGGMGGGGGAKRDAVVASYHHRVKEEEDAQSYPEEHEDFCEEDGDNFVAHRGGGRSRKGGRSGKNRGDRGPKGEARAPQNRGGRGGQRAQPSTSGGKPTPSGGRFDSLKR